MAEDNKYKPKDYPEDIDEAHRELDRRLRPMEDERDEIGKRISAERRAWKEVTGVALGVFDGARRDAQILDEEKRKKKVADHVAVFNALSPGEQLSFGDLVT